MQLRAYSTYAACTRLRFYLSTRKTRSGGACLSCQYSGGRRATSSRLSSPANEAKASLSDRSPCLRNQVFAYQSGVNFFIEDGFVFDEGHSLSESAGRDGLLRKITK